MIYFLKYIYFYAGCFCWFFGSLIFVFRKFFIHSKVFPDFKKVKNHCSRYTFLKVAPPEIKNGLFIFDKLQRVVWSFYVPRALDRKSRVYVQMDTPRRDKLSNLSIAQWEPTLNSFPVNEILDAAKKDLKDLFSLDHPWRLISYSTHGDEFLL